MDFNIYQQFYKDNGYLAGEITWNRLPEYLKGIIENESYISDVKLTDGVLKFEGKGVAFSEDLDLSSTFLKLNNTTPYTPTEDYHPATKKYVDENSGGSDPLVFSGTAILMNSITGSYNNTPQTASTYTIETDPAPIDGGKAKWIVDTTGLTVFPTVTGATQVSGDDFEADILYDAFMIRYGTNNEYFFVKR